MTGPANIGRAELVMRLRARGIGDVRLLAAIEQVPRDRFIPQRFAAFAYEERAIPLSCGQTASSVLEAAELGLAARIRPEHRVMEVGTGSGYLTAILSHMAAHVFSVERYRRLVDLATERLLEHGADNVVLVHADGFLGLSEHAPFDRIIVGGACEVTPEHLLDQLADNGEMIAAIGPPGAPQIMTRFMRKSHGIDREEVGTLWLPPLVSGRSKQI